MKEMTVSRDGPFHVPQNHLPPRTNEFMELSKNLLVTRSSCTVERSSWTHPYHTISAVGPASDVSSYVSGNCLRAGKEASCR
jgi:hypothetical protein